MVKQKVLTREEVKSGSSRRDLSIGASFRRIKPWENEHPRELKLPMVVPTRSWNTELFLLQLKDASFQELSSDTSLNLRIRVTQRQDR